MVRNSGLLSAMASFQMAAVTPRWINTSARVISV
jgi:hypothetical protein